MLPITPRSLRTLIQTKLTQTAINEFNNNVTVLALVGIAIACALGGLLLGLNMEGIINATKGG